MILFEAERKDQSILLTPKFPIIVVPGRLSGDLNSLLQAEINRIAFRASLTVSVDRYVELLSVYVLALQANGDVEIIAPQYCTDHARCDEFITIKRDSE